MIELKNEIEKILDNLIENAKKVIDNTKIEIRDKKTKKVIKIDLWKKLEENQMRNLLEIAKSVNSIKAIELFIEYQMGRKKIPKEFGDNILKKFNDDLHKFAEKISEKLSINIKKVKIEIIRQYLGYLNRYFVYRAKTS